MKPGGHILVVVPNDFNRLQMELNYFGFIGKAHVNYFTPQSLQYVMEQAGLKVVHKSATFPMELFIFADIDYRGNDQLGRKCHRFRLRIERLFGWRIFWLYQKWFNWWGIGRELIFVGEVSHGK